MKIMISQGGPGIWTGGFPHFQKVGVWQLDKSCQSFFGTVWCLKATAPTGLCQKDKKCHPCQKSRLSLDKRVYRTCSEGVPFPCQKVMAVQFFSSWKVRLKCFFEMPCPLHKGHGLYSLSFPCQKVVFLYHCHGPCPLDQYRAQHEPEKI